MKKQEMTHLQVLQAPPNYDPLETQKTLQNYIKQKNPDSPVLAERAGNVGEAATIVYINAMAAIMELSEMVDHLPFKWWKNYGQVLDLSLDEADYIGDGSITEAKFELVDAMHFLLNCAIALGMTWEEVINVFYTKQTENHRRQDDGY